MNLDSRVSVLLVLLMLRLPSVVSFEVEEFESSDRDALLQIRDSMSSTENLHKNWTGPPCINNQSRWYGVSCRDWRVVGLVLEGIQLTGSLPPTFLQNITYLTNLSFHNNSVFGQLPNLTNLMNLEHVLFSYNQFTGSIPVEYIDLPNLKQFELQQNYIQGEIPPFRQETLAVFNVSYNQLEGSIPVTNVLQRFPNSSFDHNSNLCGFPLQPCLVPPPSLPPPPEDTKKKLPIWIIILIAAAAALFPFLIMILFLCYYRKTHGDQDKKEIQQEEVNKMAQSGGNEDPERTVELEFFDKGIPIFDLDDLLRASAEVLGKGRIGTTYKVTLESGTTVAVKRVKNMNNLSKKEFIQQMQLLGKIRHENLTHILSFYHSKEEKLVIYEYFPDGNLFELLHENRGAGREPLEWRARLSIIRDIAKALSYLHQSLPSHRVPHANLKTTNILIQRNERTYHIKLTNYGFLPLLHSRKSSQKLAIGRSPEFCQGKRLTHKADVYCFGIVLLEVITGRIPEEDSPRNDDEKVEDLSEWVRTAVNNDWSTDILDIEIMAAREGHNEMLKLTELALECTDVVPEKRPKMSEVLRRIQEIQQIEGSVSVSVS